MSSSNESAIQRSSAHSQEHSTKVQLSIVIVTWNNVRIIRECLRSLEMLHTHSSAEIIVVDNASSDGTPDLVEREFASVRLIRNERNMGFAGGNNIGIRLSSGEYVCLVNSDVVVSEGCIENLAQYMGDHPDIGLLGPKMILSNGSVGQSCMRFPTVSNWLWRALALDAMFRKSQTFGAYLMTYFRYDRVADVEVLTGWFWMVRRKAMEQVGLLDERFFMYGEDIDWCKRFHEAGWRIVFYPEAVALHYCGASSSKMPTRFYIEMTRANLEYCRRHHSRLGVVGFWLASWIHEMVRIAGYGASYIFRRPGRSDAALKVKRSWGCLLWLMGLADLEVRGAV
jgi:GT2 family glycosyltransferase